MLKINPFGFRKSASGAGLDAYQPKSAREVYHLYKEQFGFDPKKASHLQQFSKQKGYKLNYNKATNLLTDPPKPPRGRLPTGEFQWSDSDSDDSNDNNDDDDNKSISSDDDNNNNNNLLTVDDNIPQRGSVYEQHKDNNTFFNDDDNISHFDQFNRTQLIHIGDIPDVSSMSKYVLPTSRKEQSRTHSMIIDDISDTSLLDASGYNIIPFTNNIIIQFHLDITTKSWPKESRNFLKVIENLFGIKARDYNILTVCKNKSRGVESNISILIRRFSNKFPSYRNNYELFLNHLDIVLSPLKRTFKDSTSLLKMLKNLDFAQIDTGGKNQVDRTEFDNYFNSNTVEPLDPVVLNNLFNTLDADGDGEITALEFFKWKTRFNRSKLTSMFPIINYNKNIELNFYKNCKNPRIKLGLNELKNHLYKHLQDHPFELNISNIFYVNNDNKSSKYQSFNGFKQSKLLFLIHNSSLGNGLCDSDIHNILNNSITKKGKLFNSNGLYGQGYYLTSHIQYALNDIYFNEISEFSDDNSDNKSNLTVKKDGHKRQITNMDQSRMNVSSKLHGEYTIIACLVNPGKINYLTDYSRGKKISKHDSNFVQSIIGNWGNKLFGSPESHYQTVNDNNSYYNGVLYDLFIVKNHERILPKYVLNVRRQNECFIWMDEKYDEIRDTANKLIITRQKLNKYLPNIIYGGDKIDKVLRLIRLKMLYTKVFLLRFVGINVNVNNNMGAFIKYIRGNSVNSNIRIKIYPITIIFNVKTKKQLWNLIIRDNLNKKCKNVRGSAKSIFNYIKTKLGKITPKNNKKNQKIKLTIGNVNVLVISIKFVKTDDEIKELIKQQIKDSIELEKEFNNDQNLDKNYMDDNDGTKIEQKYKDDDQKQPVPQQKKQKSAFKIQVTSVDGKNDDDDDDNDKERLLNLRQARSLAKQRSLKRQRSAEEKIKNQLNSETISKLLSLNLPDEVSVVLESPSSYELPDEKDAPDLYRSLERDLRKMTQGLHDQSPNQRKYSKLAILKYSSMLSMVYERYCKLGGDIYWLTLDGFMWMLHDSNIPIKNTECTDETCKQLFNITYKMHHRLKSKNKSKHKLELSTMYGDNDFNDPDPWTGIWKKFNNKPSSPSNKPSTPTTPTVNNFLCKLRKIGDRRINGCINNISYADITGSFNSLNYSQSNLTIKFKQRRRAGIKRIWKCVLQAPVNIMSPITMRVEWRETGDNNAVSVKMGKFILIKESSLDDNDVDIPKSDKAGLSRHEFFDCILSLSITKYNSEYEYQFQCIDSLCINHLIPYIYKNILKLNKNLMSVNEKNKKTLKAQNLLLRKLFKKYASLDGDDNADDDLLGENEFTSFAVDLFKTAKTLNKNIWSQKGKPTFNEIRASFILSKGEMELDNEELDFLHFQKCIINLCNFIFKYQPNHKYKIISFEKKLDLVIKWMQKLNRTGTRSMSKHNLAIIQPKNKQPKKINKDIPSLDTHKSSQTMLQLKK